MVLDASIISYLRLDFSELSLALAQLRLEAVNGEVVEDDAVGVEVGDSRLDRVRGQVRVKPEQDRRWWRCPVGLHKGRVFLRRTDGRDAGLDASLKVLS